MTKKQNILFNFILIVSGLFITPSLTAQDLENKSSLSQADSLFKERKYTESFEIYHQILENEGQASPQMLMKMAYIKEGLGNYSQALLYLNKYYLLTSNKNARTKMQDIAEEHTLEGYEVTDTDFFKGLVNRNYFLVNISILAIALLLFVVVVYRKFWSKTNAYPYAISMCVLLIVFFFVSNFQLSPEQVIVTHDHAYLMDGPSSGSDLVEVIQKGHRLTVVTEDDVWCKVMWRDTEVYVKQSMVEKVI
ncbi:hypothetical protein N6H18_18010 [Reichenbachiella agarivorans]|uniref:SH3 domain-containing protein n=1 Tax=Reichenbachiella agarivorans TaxID=2979464 RepID=A0ABY6CNY9_9BACT|nr:hypothetical protein [Reichenbachiella agarivorans]UXP32238.1 hypothetical protein N6H18_18010 [Reichenbachiella agarivorans]